MQQQARGPGRLEDGERSKDVALITEKGTWAMRVIRILDLLKTGHVPLGSALTFSEPQCCHL